MDFFLSLFFLHALWFSEVKSKEVKWNFIITLIVSWQLEPYRYGDGHSLRFKMPQFM